MDRLKRSSLQTSWSINTYASKHEEAEGLRFIGEIALGFCHNLRSPLSVILMNAELIRLASDHNPRIRRFAERIIDQGDKLSYLIDNIAEKVIRDRKKEEEWLDINALFKFELELFENNLFYKHQVTKEVQFDESCPMIRGVSSDFSRTFNQLINNALDAMIENKEKRLTVKTMHEDDNIVLEVSNTGVRVGERYDRDGSGAFLVLGGQESEKGRDQKLGLDVSAIRRFGDKYGVNVDVINSPERMTFRLVIPANKSSS